MCECVCVCACVCMCVCLSVCVCGCVYVCDCMMKNDKKFRDLERSQGNSLRWGVEKGFYLPSAAMSDA